MIFKGFFTLAIASALGLAVLGNLAEDETEDNDDNEVTVTLDEVPAAVKAAILNATEGATIAEIEKETENGQEVFEVEAVVRDVEFELSFDAKGNLLEFEIEDEGDDEDGNDDEDGEEDDADDDADDADDDAEDSDAEDDEASIPLSDVPPKARTAILAYAGDAEIAEVEVEEEGGVKLYEAEWIVEGAEHEVVVSADGELVAQEEEIPLSAAPVAVQRAVKLAFPAGLAPSVDRMTIVVYEIEAEMGDKEKEILVISTGQRVEIELDDDDDDDEGEDEDE